ncbi:MAG: hypothetical protein KA383_17605 [Phycisphaerae bacterium]|nr:hypothetical protein [Phycisphaerae bacterium]
MPPIRPIQPKRWRIQAQAVDGLTVTLGRYDTEEEAHRDCSRFQQEGAYRNLRVAPIPPPAQSPPEP